MAEIVWAPRALDDLDALINYISRDSSVRAKRFASRLIYRIGGLSSQSDSGALLPEDDRGIYREIYQGAYRVIYRHKNGCVWIVAIHHSAKLLTGDDLL
jgi:toxin ParE1/3/4